MVDIIAGNAAAALTSIGGTASKAFLLRAAANTASSTSDISRNAGITEINLGIVAVGAAVISTRVALTVVVRVGTIGVKAGKALSVAIAACAGVQADLADSSSI